MAHCEKVVWNIPNSFKCSVETTSLRRIDVFIMNYFRHKNLIKGRTTAVFKHQLPQTITINHIDSLIWVTYSLKKSNWKRELKENRLQLFWRLLTMGRFFTSLSFFYSSFYRRESGQIKALTLNSLTNFLMTRSGVTIFRKTTIVGESLREN